MLTIKRQGFWGCGDGVGELSADGAAGFDKGRWPVRLLADQAGFCLPPVSPMWAIARVPLSNPVAALELSRLIAAREPLLFAPADRHWPGRSGSGSVSEGQGAEAAARAAPEGRLETV